MLTWEAPPAENVIWEETGLPHQKAMEIQRNNLSWD